MRFKISSYLFNPSSTYVNLIELIKFFQYVFPKLVITSSSKIDRQIINIWDDIQTLATIELAIIRVICSNSAHANLIELIEFFQYLFPKFVITSSLKINRVLN